MIGIYKWTNKINNKIYIGQSVCIENRSSQHLSRAFCPTSNEYNSLLHQAFREFGIENFQFDIIEQCTIEELNNKEKYYIKLYNSIEPNGYNRTKGGQCWSNTGHLFEENDIRAIIDELRSTNKFCTEIADEWGCSPELIKAINSGWEYHLDNENYPIRKQEQITQIKKQQGWFTNQNNPSRILTDEVVKNIIDDLINTKISIIELSKKYDISTDQISRINMGKIWLHIQRPIPCRTFKNKALEVAELLATTTLTQKEIMELTGYKDRHTIQRINQHIIYKDLLKDYPNPIRQ